MRKIFLIIQIIFIIFSIKLSANENIYLPTWFSHIVSKDDYFTALGVAKYTKNDSLYKKRAKELATVTIARMLGTYVVNKIGNRDYEDDVVYESKKARFSVCVTSNPDTMNYIKKHIVLLDTFKFDNYYYGLFSFPDSADNFNSNLFRFNNKSPEWYQISNEIKEDQYISFGKAESENQVYAWKEAIDNALERLAHTIEINVTGTTKDILRNESSTIKISRFLEAALYIKNFRIEKHAITKEYKQGSVYYTTYVKVVYEKG